jgi:hypothetical protein
VAISPRRRNVLVSRHFRHEKGRLLHGAAQPGGGAELLPGAEAVDGVDLQEDRRRQDADAGSCLQDGQLGRVVPLRGLLDRGLQAPDGGVQRLQQGQVGLDAAADEGVGDVGGDGRALGLVLKVVGDRRQVRLAAGGVDVAAQLSPLADQPQPGA